ncbi:30829_t:CDS:1, partial [Racocetra persica]
MYQAHQFSFQSSYNPIIDALWHMFMRQCTKIISLSITILSPTNSPTGIVNVSNFMDAKFALSHLQNFSFVISNKNEKDCLKIQELLNQLPLVCNKINRMEYVSHGRVDPNVTNISDIMTKIIETQH